VVAVGPGRLTDEGKRLPLDLKVGDEILYSKYSGTEVKYGGEELLVLNGEHDILAVIERK
jgi:chaperonin GroES